MTRYGIYYYIVILVGLTLILTACGETIYRDTQKVSDGHVEFAFRLEPSDKTHKIYFNYDFHFRGRSTFVDFIPRLFFPNGKVLKDRITYRNKLSNSSDMVISSGDSWKVFKIKPVVGGNYRFIVDILDSNFEIEKAEIQIKKY